MQVSQFVLCVLTSAVLLSIACDRTSGSEYVTGRSSEGYQVRLSGALDSAPKAVFVSEVVRGELINSRSGKRFELFRADLLDLTFRDVYPTEEWISARILRFGTPRKGTQARRGVLLLNDSINVTSLLRVECGDMFLAFDLPQGGKANVECPVTDWVAVSAEFANGESIRERVFSISATEEPISIRLSAKSAKLER